jgi:hypothetical protein
MSGSKEHARSGVDAMASKYLASSGDMENMLTLACLEFQEVILDKFASYSPEELRQEVSILIEVVLF